MMEARSAAAIFSVLEAEASPARKLALSRLKAACDHLGRHGSIKLSAIEEYIRRTAGNEVGPRAQSISNERSRTLGMYHYVLARNRERDTSASDNRARKRPRDLNRIIDSITDIDLRTEMRDLYDRMQVAEANYARARHVLKTLRPGVDLDAMLAGQQVGKNLHPTPGVESATLLRAIYATLTNEERLAACGLCFAEGVVRRRVGTRDQLFGVKMMESLASVVRADA